MMLSLLSLALQLHVAARLDTAHVRERAHAIQATFERSRRARLPVTLGGGGRCDVRVGRFCWWYEDDRLPPVAEPEAITRARDDLVTALDSLGIESPADPFIAGLRVHYRVEGRHWDDAARVAQSCVTAAWWCGTLRGYAATAAGRAALADSAFAAALRDMPDSTRCAWTDIRVILPAPAREGYERLPCTARDTVERRYWMLATPRLGAEANEWRLEYFARRVVVTVLASALTPHRLAWGSDTEELVLRYGWPLSWSRTLPGPLSTAEPDIVGHDPAPSFHHGAVEGLLRDPAASSSDSWNLADVRAESRFAHPHIGRIAPMTAQVARFRRGDSTLLVASYATGDDSLAAATAVLGIARATGQFTSRVIGSGRRGTGTLTVTGDVAMAGVELLDTTTGSFGRTRHLWPPPSNAPEALSDVLLHDSEERGAESLEDALAQAMPGTAIVRTRPVGLYWEVYGTRAGGDSLGTAIRVERLDQGVVASIRERLGFADPESPVQVHWTEARPPSAGVTRRSLSLDLARLPAGRYRIGLSVNGAAPGPLTRQVEVELVDP